MMTKKRSADQNSYSDSDKDGIIIPEKKMPKLTSCYERKLPSKVFRDPRFASWLVKSKKNENKASCKVCNCEIAGSVAQIERHGKTRKHFKNQNFQTHRYNQTSLKPTRPSALHVAQVVAELKMCDFIADHNLPIKTLDHLASIIANVCHDSITGKKYTKTKENGGMPKFSNVVDASYSDDDISQLTIDETTDKFKATMSTNTVPAIGKPAPSFKATAVINGEFKEICLEDYKDQYLVLFFYPLDFTFVCPTEIIAFSERVSEFRSIGCEVVACSTDSHFSHLAWINTDRKDGGLGNMDIPILADKTMEIAKAYGVLKEEDGVAFRGLFIIDRKQNLRQVTINDLPVGRDVDETLRLVQAFQFTDEHGEVCPAGWKPGSKTMKADPEGSKDYFASEN